MAKSSKKRQNQAVSIDDIYEMMKGKNFTEDLWLDLLSDIKEKPTYKRMKEMVDSVINDKLRDFELEPVDNADRLRRRAALTEISIMAYAIDRVISEVLYKRLQNEFKTLIVDMLGDLQSKKPVEKSVTPVKISSMFENIESIFSDQEEKKENEVTKSPESPNKVTNQKLLRKKGCSPKLSPDLKDKGPESPNKVTNQKQVRKKDYSPKLSPDLKDKASSPGLTSAANSDSEWNVSIGSISSVHTTDLSSFDDNVSLCSDDGFNGLKRKFVSLKKANTLVVEGKLPEIYQIAQKSEQIKEAQMDPNRKLLPQRKRKPNSKYNAETMFYEVKDYFSDRSESPISSPADDIETIRSQSQTIRETKRRKTGSCESREVSPPSPVPTRSTHNQSSSKNGASHKAASPNSNSTPQKSSAKRYNTSDLYKPRFNFGSTYGSRGKAAFNSLSE